MSGMARDFQGNAYEQHEMSHPPVYYCEAPDCETYGLLVDDGDMDRCADCESVFCAAHRVPDRDCHVELCADCRHGRDVARLSVED